jgi:transcriptional regulator with XRE-family HTH domain
MTDIGTSLRAAREAAKISLAVMATRTHFSKPYLGLVETGRRPATADIVKAYERVLGVGGLGDDVDRRRFLGVAAAVAVNAKLAAEVTASIASRDPYPLATVQTTHGADLAIAALMDRPAAKTLRTWMTDGGDPILRVNAAGILAKLPGQEHAEDVVSALMRDAEASDRYLTAVVARVCSLDWSTAVRVAREPAMFPEPSLVADRFAREALNPQDAGARWCSAMMLQRLSPMIGGNACS